jgi:hypothetical protein
VRALVVVLLADDVPIADVLAAVNPAVDSIARQLQAALFVD